MFGITQYARLPQLTIGLIVISIAVTATTQFGQSSVTGIFMISKYMGSSFIDIREGEIWRLVSPIFLHLSFLHILFNMMWLWDLGGTVELLQGKKQLFLQVILYGIAGNIAQYWFVGPLFGGMSGVVYGLLAYIWMQAKFNPGFAARLQKEVVIMMLVWFLLCWTGILGPIANMAHTAGLVLGLGWGYVHAQIVKSSS